MVFEERRVYLSITAHPALWVPITGMTLISFHNFFIVSECMDAVVGRLRYFHKGL